MSDGDSTRRVPSDAELRERHFDKEPYVLRFKKEFEALDVENQTSQGSVALPSGTRKVKYYEVPYLLAGATYRGLGLDLTPFGRWLYAFQDHERGVKESFERGDFKVFNDSGIVLGVGSKDLHLGYVLVGDFKTYAGLFGVSVNGGEDTPVKREGITPMGHEKPQKLRTLNLAFNTFWSDVDRDDKTTWPKNEEVADFLEERGFSDRLAASGATIVRPDWAK